MDGVLEDVEGLPRPGALDPSGGCIGRHDDPDGAITVEDGLEDGQPFPHPCDSSEPGGPRGLLGRAALPTVVVDLRVRVRGREEGGDVIEAVTHVGPDAAGEPRGGIDRIGVVGKGLDRPRASSSSEPRRAAIGPSSAGVGSELAGEEVKVEAPVMHGSRSSRGLGKATPERSLAERVMVLPPWTIRSPNSS